MLRALIDPFQILQLFSIRVFFFKFLQINFLLINLSILLSFINYIYCNASYKNYLQETFFFLVLIFGKTVLNLFLK